MPSTRRPDGVAPASSYPPSLARPAHRRRPRRAARSRRARADVARGGRSSPADELRKRRPHQAVEIAREDAVRARELTQVEEKERPLLVLQRVAPGECPCAALEIPDVPARAVAGGCREGLPAPGGRPPPRPRPPRGDQGGRPRSQHLAPARG